MVRDETVVRYQALADSDWCFPTAIIHFWKPIKRQLRKSTRELPDIHAHLMARYPDGRLLLHPPLMLLMALCSP